ncbi:transcriptional regulator [Candidatus Bathyarchaeota archaeon]|nr:MAG: transcriptional regulator [Candidatus Bathyarchaeota archaeon]
MTTTSVPKYWREIKYRYRLIGSRCLQCGKIFFPHRAVCRVCGSRKLEDYKLSEKGEVLSFTVIRRNSPSSFEKNVPYIVGLIKLENGITLLSQIVDCSIEEVSIGMPVELTFRKIKEAGKEGIIEYGFKFRPVLK